MRASPTLSLALIASLGLVAALPGCSRGKKSHFDSSTAAASTSGSSASPTTSSSTTGPVTSSTLPPPPPPPVTLLTDAVVSSFLLQEAIEVDAQAGTVSNRWATGRGPADVVNAGTFTYVANALSQDVTVIDRLANNTAGSIDVTATPITGVSFLSFLDPILKPLVRPTGLAVTPSGTKLFSANLLNVTVCDTATLQPTKSILGLNTLNLSQILTNPTTAIGNFLAAPVRGLGMCKVAATNDHALVTCMITGTVMRIDARTDSLIDYVDVGRAPIGIAIAQGKAYVACAMSQEIWIIDVATGAVRGRTTAGMVPVDCATSPSEDKIYVANAVSGDISVIDTALDIVVDTLPAGMSILSIFQQLGVTIPSGGGQSGIMNLLNGFLQGFTGGMTNPSSFGNLLTGGSGGLLSPGNLINGLLSAFLAYAGITQQSLGNLNMPGIGILSVSVAHNPIYVCAANSFLGELAVTDTTSRNVSSFMGLTGIGPADVAAIWRR